MTRSREEYADERAPLLVTHQASYTAPREPNSEVAAKASWLHPSQRQPIALLLSIILTAFVIAGALLTSITLRDGKVSIVNPPSQTTPPLDCSRINQPQNILKGAQWTPTANSHPHLHQLRGHTSLQWRQCFPRDALCCPSAWRSTLASTS